MKFHVIILCVCLVQIQMCSGRRKLSAQLSEDTDPANCPDNFQSYSKAIDKMKSVSYLRPKIIEDAMTIRDKFPCMQFVRLFVEKFVRLLHQTTFVPTGHINMTCAEEQRLAESDDHRGLYAIAAPSTYRVLEKVLPTRLPNETFRAILDFSKSYQVDYRLKVDDVFVDIPQTQCPLIHKIVDDLDLINDDEDDDYDD